MHTLYSIIVLLINKISANVIVLQYICYLIWIYVGMDMGMNVLQK